MKSKAVVLPWRIWNYQKTYRKTLGRPRLKFTGYAIQNNLALSLHIEQRWCEECGCVISYQTYIEGKGHCLECSNSRKLRSQKLRDNQNK